MTRDLTKGSIVSNILSYTIPLIFGNIFQLTYNAVDSIVIGRFAGKNSLAAVGTADPVMNLLILGITGLCIGASVLISNFFGAGDLEKVKRELATGLVICGGFSLIVLLLGIFLSRPILQLMQVPAEIMKEADIYLKIIFIGMPFTCLYNVYAAALRSVGDAATPIKFLIVACVLNAGLDVVLVAGLGLGGLGAGLATDIAQSVSAFACILYVYRRVPSLHLNRSHFRLEKELVHKTIRYGMTTALQQCSQPLGKLFIQGMVNTLGVSTMAAFNAVGKIEDFALVPERSIGNAMMTFTAQNDGAGEKKRIRKGFHRGMLLELSYFVMIFFLLKWFYHPLLLMFSEDEMTLAEGGKYFQVMIFFYFLPALTNGMQGFFRGVKHMNITLFGTLTQISFRVIFTFFLIPVMGITGIAYACAAGWAAMLILEGIYYRAAGLHRLE